MMKKLFERPHAIQRQLSSPLLEARQRYLTYCAEHGVAKSTLREIAIYQLIVIDFLKLQGRVIVSYGDIEAAAERWSQYKAGSFSKTRFIKHATHWLRFLNLLKAPALPTYPFSGFIKEFADFMREERGLSIETINFRCGQIKTFLAELYGQRISLSDLAITQIDNVLLQRINQGKFSRRTIQTQASALRSFFRYAEQRGWCQCGLANAIRAPRVFRHETLPFSPAWKDVLRLLANTDSARPTDIRDRAILLLLAVYGLRSSEVCQLQIEDLDWEHELLQFRRVKKGQIQQFPLSRTVGGAILRYLQEVRPRSACRALFLTMRAPFRPLKPGAIGQLVRRRWQPLDVILEHYGPHSLRHACATRLINKGVSLKEIGDQLGHRNLETTRIYAKVDLTHLREVADFNIGGLLCD